MRWEKPKIGEMRVVKKFLLFPKRIDNECRWLEFVEYIQVYNNYDPKMPRIIYNSNHWFDKKWVHVSGFYDKD